MLTLVGRLLHIVGRLPALLNPNSCCTRDTRCNGASTVACQSAGPSMAEYKAVSEAMQRPP